MPQLRIVSIFAIALLSASAGSQPEPTAPLPWAAPPIDRAVSVFDGRTGELLTFDAMLDALAAADAVFLGESHIDETTHRVELAVYQGLLNRRHDNVVLAMEMFDRDVQPILNQYLAGDISEPEFLDSSRPWAQYRSAYRPLIEHARAGKHPAIASNYPRPLTRRISMEGLEVLDSLTDLERAQVPAQLFPNTPAYFNRVDNAIRGHLAMMGARDADDPRLDSTQTLWDNAMGDSVALALDANPGSSVLHINGGFHSAYFDGTVRQFSLRKPNAKVLTVDINSARNPSVIQIGKPSTPVADFVIFAETRATDLNEGTHTVALDSTLKYRLHIPESASEDNPVPLLIWLGPDGLTSQDGMDLWKDRLGDEAAIATLEPTYRARLADLSEGGRWFWPDSFAQDVFSVVNATEEIWAYLLRYHNIDPARVVVAGEGTGATIVAVNALQGDRMSHKAIAFAPSRYAKLKDFPLPLPEYNDQSDREVSLAVFASGSDSKWWREELGAYREIGAAATVNATQGWPNDSQNSAIRDALALPTLILAPEYEPAYMIVSSDTPRAWHWSRLYALEFTTNSFGQKLMLVGPDETGDFMSSLGQVTPEITPDSVASDIPKCPGPFGGTTILVLPQSLSPEETQAWLDLETNDPLNAKSRFHRLRIAYASKNPGNDASDRSLSAMLTKLESENRKNVLIVPAEFCADVPTMQSLERQTRNAADRMTIQWLPGLGG